MKNNKSKIAITVVLILVLILSLCVYLKFKPQTTDGTKHITFTVVTESESKEFDIETTAQYLSTALEENGLLEGYEGDYGLFVTAVNSVVANSENEEWWCFTKGGEIVMTGVDSTPISDGDKFEATLKVGYN